MSDVTGDGHEERRARFIQHFIEGVPHHKTLGVTYRAHGDDWAELTIPHAAHLLVDETMLASGAIFSLMDSTAGFAVFIRQGVLGHATLDLRLDYLRGAEPGIAMIARAECYRMTRQVAFVRGIAHQGDPSRPVANMAGTFMLPGSQ